MDLRLREKKTKIAALLGGPCPETYQNNRIVPPLDITGTRAYMLGGKRLYITAAEANANITVPLFRTPPNKLRVLGCQFRRVSLSGSDNRS